jgi:RHS repeat-associated protein
MDVENVVPDLDGDFQPTGTHTRDVANPWFTTQYTYDLLDNPVRVTAEVTTTRRITTELRYDPMENLLSVTFPEGNGLAYDYDERNLVRAVTWGAGSPEAASTTYDYDANGMLVRSFYGEGHLTDFFYDGFERQVGQVDALGNVSIWRYDPNGNQVETIMRDGQDGRNPGRAITATTAITLAHSVDTFDEHNRRYLQRRSFFIAHVDGGVSTPLATDANGDGWVETAMGYDRNGNVTSVTDDNGYTIAFAYDGLNRLVLVTDALSNTTAYSLDGIGNVVQTIATERQPDALLPAETFTTTNGFDALNRLVETTDSLGQTSRYAYDSHDNVVFMSDANGPLSGAGIADSRRSTTEVVATSPANDHGNTALFVYDGLNRLLEETYHLRAGGVGSGAVTGEVTMSYAYDGNGNLTRRSDPNGNPTRYTYDALDRTTLIAYADGTTQTMAYDRAHNLAERIDPNGSVITYTYDALNRHVRADVARAPGVAGTTRQTFEWDGLSRMVGATDDNDPDDPGDDGWLAFTYDSLSNLTGETQDGDTVSRTYDGVGNRLSLTYPVTGLGASSGGTVLTYTYDALNRVTSIADAGGTLAAYDYIGPARVLTRTNGNGTYTSYSYDGARRVTGVAHHRSSDDALLSRFSYTYDRGRNRTGETAEPGGTISYTYDSLYRLTGAQGPDSASTYTYDAAGDRVLVTADGVSTAYAANQMHEYESVDGETRTHDANGSLLSRRFTVETVVCTALSAVTAAGPATTSVGSAATFSATVTPATAAQPVTYTWAATGQSPLIHTGGISDSAVYTWAMAGPQVVTVTAVNGCGVVVSDTHPVTVEALPCDELTEAGIRGPTAGYTGTLYGFTAVITPSDATAPVTYTWSPEPDAGQGTTSASYQWGEPGVYTITLTAENCGGPVSDTHTIAIESAPPVCPDPLEFVAIDGPTGGYTDTLHAFTAVITPSDATTPVTYTWSPEPEGGQGTISASYQWGEPGVYTITLTAENCGGPVSDTHSVEIVSPPPVCPRPLESVAIDGPTDGYTDTLYAFTAVISPADATPPITYTWAPEPDVGQGTTSASYEWASTGLYTITLTAENCGGPVSDTHTVEIVPPAPICPQPLESVAIDGPTGGYTDTLYGFTAVITPAGATPPTTYTWSPEPDAGQGTTSASYQWTSTGVHTITLTAENCGGAVSDTHAIAVESPPPVCPSPLGSVAIDGPTDGYTDTLYGFTAVITPADATAPVTYTWAPEPTTGQGTTSASYEWASTGVHTITLAVENCGGAVSDTHTIAIELPPPVCPRPLESAAIDGPTAGYTDTLYGFTAVITPVGATAPITYTWSPEPDTGQGMASASYEWASAGVYTITLTVENCGGPVSDTHTVAIESPPPVCPHPLESVAIDGPTDGYTDTLYAFTAVITPADATAPIALTWSPEPDTGQGMTSASYEWASTGVYTITLMVENCGGAVGATHRITVGAEARYRFHLPLVLRPSASFRATLAEGVALRRHASSTMDPLTLSGTTVVSETLILYTYDFADRLVGVTELITVTGGGDEVVISQTIRYTYDALGRQVVRQTDDGTVRALYAGGRVIEERDATDAVLATYVEGLIIARGGSRSFYQADGVGSVRALADQTGSIVERVDYEPFGVPIFSHGGGESGVGNPYLFRGRRYDSDTGLYGQAGRRYDPALGRYLQRGAEALGNPYTFAGNNPLGGDRR